MSNTQLYARDAYGSTYANPSNPEFTVRFKTSHSGKSLGSTRVSNTVTEIIVNDLTGVTVNGTNANENIAVRIRISGSSYSHERLKTIVKGLAGQLSAWADENVLIGFEPVTLPLAY